MTSDINSTNKTHSHFLDMLLLAHALHAAHRHFKMLFSHAIQKHGHACACACQYSQSRPTLRAASCWRCLTSVAALPSSTSWAAMLQQQQQQQQQQQRNSSSSSSRAAAVFMWFSAWLEVVACC
jgi:hypothetical protein